MVSIVGKTESAGIAATPDALAKILDDCAVLWVGAGASVAAGYPATTELAHAMVRRADDPIAPTRSFFEIAELYRIEDEAGSL